MREARVVIRARVFMGPETAVFWMRVRVRYLPIWMDGFLVI